MGLIKSDGIKYFEREEEQQIYNQICNVAKNKTGNEIIVFGESGVGKTTLVKHAVQRAISSKNQSNYQIIYYDAAKQSNEIDKDYFYNTLIYKTINEKKPTLTDLTKINKNKSFLSYLDKASYKENIKSNIKQSLISSLCLIPTIGSTIYTILSINKKDFKQIYFDNSVYFLEYINQLSQQGVIFIIDNANYIPETILNEFCSQIQFELRISLILINSIDNIENLTHSKINEQIHTENICCINIENISFDEFKNICENNFTTKTYKEMQPLINNYYTYVENGNFRLMNDFYFRVINRGLDNIKDSPLIENINEMDEIKQNILDLLTIFNSSVKEELINKIILLNDFCEKEKIAESLFYLTSNKYIEKNENNSYSIEHNKISIANNELLNLDYNQERHMELYNSCEEVLTKELYKDISDVDFVFCITELLKISKQFDIVKNIGVVSKYIQILDMKYKYSDICILIDKIIYDSNDINITLLFPISILMKVLNAYQKTSAFATGYNIARIINNNYNINTYMSKFKLQMYEYDESIKIIKPNLNCYEAWSIYLNALQHLRHDKLAKEHIQNLKNNYPEYYDKEFYIIILRNSGHLFDYKDALLNLETCIEYFINHENLFALSTCYNNIGLIHLYQYNTDYTKISVSRKYFKKAREIMNELKSKEEYQSLFNIGLSYICENNYTVAESYIDKAIQIIPNVLTFDSEKFLCTKYLCQMFNNKINAKKCLDLICEEYFNIDCQKDNWIRYMFDYNIETLKSIIYNCDPDYANIINNYCGEPNCYGLNYIFKNNKFILAVSPHWRY